MQWTIYCHTHSSTGRHYVGQTIRTMEQRWQQHVWNSKRSTKGFGHLANAIRKYGKESFSHTVLVVCSTQEDANAAEAYWIEQLESRTLGFNTKIGGQEGPHHGRRNPWDRPEHREKMMRDVVPKLIASAQTPEARAKAKATYNTPEYAEKLSAQSKANWQDPDFRAKQIARLNTPEALARSAERGRNTALATRLREQTHCKLGHPFDMSNTARNGKGGRICKVCKNTRERGYYGPLKDETPATHCGRGHAWSDGNEWVKDGRRACRTCNRENQKERNDRFRAANPIQPKPLATHCIRGHEFTPENIWYSPDPAKNARNCKACNREKQRERKARLRNPSP